MWGCRDLLLNSLGTSRSVIKIKNYPHGAGVDCRTSGELCIENGTSLSQIPKRLLTKPYAWFWGYNSHFILFSKQTILVINHSILHPNGHDEADNPTNTGDTEQVSYRGHTLNRWRSIQGKQDLFERVSRVLAHMKELDLDFPILLSALSWGNKLLTTDGEARYHRSVLMNSQELPEIVQQWSMRSEVVRGSLTAWAIDRVTNLIDIEMNTAVGKLHCSGGDLNEATFLSITPGLMTSLLKPEVSALWSILKSASRTSQQEKWNKEVSEKV